MGLDQGGVRRRGFRLRLEGERLFRALLGREEERLRRVLLRHGGGQQKQRKDEQGRQKPFSGLHGYILSFCAPSDGGA